MGWKLEQQCFSISTIHKRNMKNFWQRSTTRRGGASYQFVWPEWMICWYKLLSDCHWLQHHCVCVSGAMIVCQSSSVPVTSIISFWNTCFVLCSRSSDNLSVAHLPANSLSVAYLPVIMHSSRRGWLLCRRCLTGIIRTVPWRNGRRTVLAFIWPPLLDFDLDY